jgi:hypothetical protein
VAEQRVRVEQRVQAQPVQGLPAREPQQEPQRELQEQG